MAVSRRQKPYFIYLLILGALVFFYRLGERDLWTRLESEAAVVGRDMLDTGRVLVPHLFDEPFVDNRPPGAFWLVAASYQLTGLRNEWAARLPSALAALVCVLMAYAAGRKAADAQAGFLSALVLLGMLTFVLMGRMSQQDMLLTLWTFLAHWAFWRSLDEKETAFRYVLAFQLFLGLGALIKGPAVVINVLFPLAVFLLYSRRWRDVKWLAFLITAPVSMALALWWYAYVWFYWPSMQEALINRFTAQSDIHLEAWYFYLVHLPELVGPVILLVFLLPSGWRKAGVEQRKGAFGFFLIMALTMFVVYTLFPSKRTHYLVPLLPQLSVALGLVITSRRHDEGRYLARSAVVLSTLFPVILLGWVIAAPYKLDLHVTVRDGVALAMTTGVAAWTWTSYLQGQRSKAFRISWVGMILAMTFILGDASQRAGDMRSARVFAEKVGPAVPGDAVLGTLSAHAALPFYSNWTDMRALDITEAEDFLQSPDHYLMVIKNKNLLRIDESLRRIVLKHYPYRHDDEAYLLRGGGLSP